MRRILCFIVFCLLILPISCNRQQQEETQASSAPQDTASSPAIKEPEPQPTPEPEPEPSRFQLSRIRLGLNLTEVRSYIEDKGVEVLGDMASDDGNGEIMTSESEYFLLKGSILRTYSPPSIYGMSESEFDELVNGFSDENPEAKRGSNEIPAGYWVMEGDVEDAARIETWLNEEAQELLVAGWRSDDGYYWVWLTKPELTSEVSNGRHTSQENPSSPSSEEDEALSSKGEAKQLPPEIEESIEYKLACINAQQMLPEDHPDVKKGKRLLDHIQERVKQSAQEIADMSVWCQQDLAKNSVDITLFELMETAKDSMPAGLDLDYAEILAMINVMLIEKSK